MRRFAHLVFWLAVASLAIVSCATAADDPLPTHGTGLVVPENLPAKARLQNARVAHVLADLDASRQRFGFSELAIPAEWDWRSLGIGLGVRNQGSCGSCWAFATVAALEGAAAIAGRSVDLSEQDVLCCSGAGSCGGGWFDAFDYAVKTGVTTEEKLPYTGRYTRCPRPAGGLRALAWGYVDADGDRPTMEAMQRALLKFGPLAIAIRADRALSAYRAGTVWRSPAGSINHAVTLVGYSTTKRAWLIKNSWGEAWGDRGYFWAAWDSNVGLGAAWCVFRPAWLQTGASGKTCPTCPTGQTGLTYPTSPTADPEWSIAGPETAECGSLVRLALPDVPGARVAWAQIPNSATDSGRLALYFAAPCTSGTHTFTGVVAVPDQDPVILTHQLTVTGGPSPEPSPGPAPDPTPDPKPDPTELGAFGAEVRDWARDLVPADVRAATAEALAEAFAGVADQVEAGKIKSLPAAMTAATAATSRAVSPANRTAWAPWFDQLTARWQQALDAGELADTAAIARAARQAAAGLRASVDRPAPGGESAAAVPIQTGSRVSRLRRK